MPAPKAAFVWLESLSATLFRIVTFSCSSFNVAAHNSPSVVGNDPLLTGDCIKANNSWIIFDQKKRINRTNGWRLRRK
jgi:hypothetical protein